MRTKRPLAMMVTSALAGLLGVAGFSAAQHQHGQPTDRRPQASVMAPHEKTMKVGKKEEVTFSKGMKVGDATLAPGTYKLQHRTEGADHFVRFQPLATNARGVTSPAGQPSEIKCRLEPLQGAAKETTLQFVNEETGQRLTRLQIRGEDVAHLF